MKKQNWFEFINNKNERVLISITEHENKLYTQTYVEIEKACIEKYNPSICIVELREEGKVKGYISELNKDWVLDASEKNKKKIIEKIKRLSNDNNYKTKLITRNFKEREITSSSYKREMGSLDKHFKQIYKNR